MRFVILNTDYPEFLAHLYRSHPGLAEASYAEQMTARFATFFGLGDFYSRNLTAAGHEAQTIIVNNDIAQRTWAREAGLATSAPHAPPGVLRRAARSLVRATPRWLRESAADVISRRSLARPAFDAEIVAEQIRRARPDVVVNQAVDGIPAAFIQSLKPYVRLMVGQHSAPMPNVDFGVYDLMISSLPNYVERFRAMGLRSELHRFAFEPRVLEHLPPEPPSIPLSFVGSFFTIHRTRTELLEYLAQHLDLQLWGNLVEPIPARSPLHGRHHGEAFGLAMYRILHASRATLNVHIASVAGPYANNMRLFEATGVGTLLVTDWKENLHEMFTPDEEVVTFRTREEAREKIEYYLAHPAERDRIAAAGQARVLRDHTWPARLSQLVETLRKYL